VHELSYCEAVLEAVERRAQGRPVTRIGVRIGTVHRIVAEAFQQSFQIAAMDGPAAEAVTEITVVPVQGHCMDCREDFISDDPAPACRACGSLDVAVDGGDEVTLEWIAYASATDVATERVQAHTHGAV
jgi:hydrogenase nickel incorporation protein HypA/HybF